MNEHRLRSALAELPLPEQTEAGQRTWRVISAAYAQAGRVALRRRPPLRPALALTVIAALAAAVLSPPGRAVLDSVRKAIGIEHAQPALFSLPDRGSLLVGSHAGGVWVVHADGSKRRLGTYAEAAWSPFGHFVVAGRANELATLTPGGELRWTLSRPGIRFPRWGGSRLDTRIAYLSRSRLHVVAGDGTNDTTITGVRAAPVAPAWRPGHGFQLAFADRHGRVSIYNNAGGGAHEFETGAGPLPTKLEWSGDGRLLLVLAANGLRVYDYTGRLLTHDTPLESRDIDASFLPSSHTIVVLRVRGYESEVAVLGSHRLLFRTSGQLTQAVPSPDGRWLLLSWPQADQWIFVHINGRRRIKADSNITTQFGGNPTISGWCCTTKP